jgi:hypothetical protein
MDERKERGGASVPLAKLASDPSARREAERERPRIRAQGSEVGGPPEMLVATAEQVFRHRSPASQRD